MQSDFERLLDRQRDFVEERGWDESHTPRSLSMSIAIEAAELMEQFQWEDIDSAHLVEDEERMERVREELADVLIYCLNLGICLDMDLLRAVEAKIERNETRFDP